MFDPRTELANNHVNIFDPIRHTNGNYNTWGSMNYSAGSQKTAHNYENYRNLHDEGIQFRPENMEDETGVCSPPLWNTSPPRSPVHSQSHPSNYRHLSPKSRAQAIARGQWELMEFVKKMPESCYELSLKDLVEQPTVEADQEVFLLQEKSFDDEVVNQKVKRQESKTNEKKAKMIRSRSIEHGGLFLKMVFPISLASKNKKKKSATNTRAKVSPKPETLAKSSKGGEKDWWKKRFRESGETSSSNGSSGSSGSSQSNSSRNTIFLPGCWPIFCFKNTKVAK